MMQGYEVKVISRIGRRYFCSKCGRWFKQGEKSKRSPGSLSCSHEGDEPINPRFSNERNDEARAAR